MNNYSIVTKLLNFMLLSIFLKKTIKKYAIEHTFHHFRRYIFKIIKNKQYNMKKVFFLLFFGLTIALNAFSSEIKYDFSKESIYFHTTDSVKIYIDFDTRKVELIDSNIIYTMDGYNVVKGKDFYLLHIFAKDEFGYEVNIDLIITGDKKIVEFVYPELNKLITRRLA